MHENPLYAEVIVNRPIVSSGEGGGGGGFTYVVPPPLRPQIRLGQLVRVPFQEIHQVGMVVGFPPVPPPGEVHLKAVEAILDPTPALDVHQLALARWLARTQLAPLSRCVALMLPPGLFPPPETLLEAVSEAGEVALSLPEEDLQLLALIREKGPLSPRSLRRRVGWPWPSIRRRLGRLIRQGLVRRTTGDALPRIRVRRENQVRLKVPWERVPEALSTLGRDSGPARLLGALIQSPDPLPELDKLCHVAQCDRSAIRALESRGWAQVLPGQTWVELAISPAEVEAVLEEVLRRMPAQARALRQVAGAGGPVSLDDLIAAGASRSALRALEERGLIRQTEEPAQVMLLLDPEGVLDALAELRGTSRGLAVLRLLREEGRPLWVGGVYAQTSANRATLRALERASLIALGDQEVVRDPLAGMAFPPEEPPTLTADQESVWKAIQSELEAWLRGGETSPIPPTPFSAPPARGGVRGEEDAGKAPPPVFLLHGVTGSGKTEIYLRALDLILGLGGQAVVLVPEIALTPQTIRRFAVRFPGRVTTLHSDLSAGERYEQWRRIRAGQADVVVGPRSALFAPLPRLCLIVMDEEHDASYKESRPPYYHAREVALHLARLKGAAVILGSATPSIESYHRAQRGEFHLLSLPQRIFRAGGPASTGGRGVVGALPPVDVVDMRQELKAGNRGMFSRRLSEAMGETLAAGQQAILLLNRRGSATFVLCRDCGHVLLCPRCELPLTYHREGEALHCHHCGFRAAPPGRCPACGSVRIRYFGVGTQRVEQAVKAQWPAARVVRWDRDTTRSKGAHERILSQFASREADVLVGTQMVAKGLDLPWVTLVGVVSADTALHLPDFRSAERTFQLLTQVAGRAGRSPLGGQVVVQTYSPEHYAIRAASRHDFVGFYRREMEFRRKMGYPPFSRLARLLFLHSRWSVCQEETARLARWLEGRLAELGLPGSALIGPVPCFFQRERGRFRWQLLIRTADPVRVLQGAPLGPGWRVDVDPVDLL